MDVAASELDAVALFGCGSSHEQVASVLLVSDTACGLRDIYLCMVTMNGDGEKSKEITAEKK